MPADVGERPYFTILTANDDRGLLRQAEYKKVASVGNLRSMARQYPVAGEDTIELQLIDFRICIESLIQSAAGFLAADQLCNA